MQLSTYRELKLAVSLPGECYTCLELIQSDKVDNELSDDNDIRMNEQRVCLFFQFVSEKDN